jgi:hypothetical protein
MKKHERNQLKFEKGVKGSYKNGTKTAFRNWRKKTFGTDFNDFNWVSYATAFRRWVQAGSPCSAPY